jgi:hypothetical protein
MCSITIDSISAKEIDNLCDITGRDVWNDCSFESHKDALEFAMWCREIAPLAFVEVWGMTTIDLAKFGFREIEMLRDILDAWVKHGLPEDFSGEGVHPMFNMNSGNVFLKNEDYQVAMLDGGDKLESFYSFPECGHVVKST